MKKFYSLTLALFLSLMFVVELQATVYTWGGSSGNWNVPTNWSPNGVPGATDDVIINAGGPTLVSDVSIQNLTVTSSATIYGDFDITIDGTLSQNCSCMLFAGNGDVIVNGAFDWTTGTLGDGIGTGTVTVNGITTMPTGSAGHWVNRKSLVFNDDVVWQAGSIGASNDGSISIAPGATLTETATTSYLLGFSYWGGTGTFLNQGTFIRSGTALLFVVGNTFLNSGTLINQLTGGLRFQGPLVNEPTGIIQGLGSIIINGSFTNNGTIAPGTAVGNLTITRSSLTTSTLEIEISGDEGPGTGHDRLQVIGNYSADGTLHGLLQGGFVPDSGFTFQILTTTGTVTGQFDSLALPGVPQNWEIAYNSNNIVLTYVYCLETYYADVDEDGYGNPDNDTLSCTPIMGYVTIADDCDDDNAMVNPLAVEICNGIDDDCDGLLDDADNSFNGLGPVTNTNSGLQYCTIQSAINAASPGDILNMDAGTYTENVLINKSLTLLGPNMAVDPCTGPLLAQAIILPSTGGASTGAATTAVITVTAPNVTISGFSIDGDNPLITSPFDVGTVNPDVDMAISAESNASGLNVHHNFIRNAFQFGVAAGNTGASPAAQGTIEYNKIETIPYWAGVILYDDYYAAIENNCIDNAWMGIQVDNFYQAATGAAEIRNNTITTETVAIIGDATYTDVHGIRINNVYQNAGTWTVADNTITNTTVGLDAGSTGLELWSVQSAVGVTVTGNSADGFESGYYLWNCPTSNTINISGTAINSTNGVLATNTTSSYGSANSTYTISNLMLTNNTNGVKVFDDPAALPSQQTNVEVNIGAGVTISGGTTGLLIENSRASLPNAGSALLSGQTGQHIHLVNSAYDVLATAVSFDGVTGITASLTQLFAIEDKINHEIDWNALGFVTVKANNAYVTDINAGQSTTNNDYTRIRNAVELADNNWSVNLKGIFDWTEPNASTSWALGNDGIVSALDDYSILVPANRNGLSFTAPMGLGTAIIQGPGDLASANLEGVLVFDGGDNQGWTISNMTFTAFDLSIGMFNGAGGTDAFNNTTITNNIFNIATDLNAVVAPADVNQNIGLHYAFGTNQTISNNIFNVAGDGVSNGAFFSSTVCMQSNTSGGSVYDGLLITGNTTNILNAQSANPEFIRGIWENGHAHASDITVSNNTFNNLAGGNNPALNMQRAFRVTSHSGAGTTVTYSGNTVNGANIGFEWIAGSNFTGNNPVQLTGNNLSNNNIGILMQSNGRALLTNTDFDAATDNARDLQIQAGSVVTTGGGNQWAGEGYYVENLSSTSLNITDEIFDESDNFRRTDRVYGALDNPASGLIRFDGSNLYVSAPGTGLSDETIPNSISAAAANGDAVNIESGSYTSGLDATSKEITVVPGASPGCVTLGGDLVLTGGDALAMEVNGATPCSSHDQLIVNGMVTLGGANLDVTLGYPPANGDEIIIINNDMGDAVVGQFLQGGSITVSGNYFLIDYAGGDGNDVVLTLCAGILNTTTMEVFCTIQEGIDDAQTLDGHTLLIAAGTYNERVTLTKRLTLDGAGAGLTVLDGTGLAGNGNGITINTGIINVTIKDLTVRDYEGANPNANAGIYGIGGNNNLTVTDVDLADNIGGSGFYANGPIDNVLMNNVDAHGHTNVNGAARGIVIWNGHKSNITITNCEVYNNNCCGIELQDGSGSGVNVSNNNVHDNWDNGIGLVGLDGTTAANLVNANTLTNNGRFGIEIKNPNGNGTNTVISNNNVTQSASFFSMRPLEVRDIAGIAVFRRSVLGSNVDVPNGVQVINNTVSGYIQDNGASASEGFGIVIEGTNHTATGNVISSNDVGLQQQAGHTPYPGDGDQSNLPDTYFGRGNSPITCGNTVAPNAYSSNGTNTRNISVGGGLVTNTNTLESFCSIQSAIDDANTLNGHTITVQAGTYAENIIVNKSMTILGPNSAINPCSGSRVAEAIVVPATAAISSGEIFHVAASNVTISGLTIDGDNPDLVSGYSSTNGADIDAAEGITVYETGINGLTATNNIIQNLSYFGVTLYDYPAGVPSTGHTISNNKIQHLGTYDVGSGIPLWGGGVLLYNNQYAAVADNCISNVRIGVQTGNYYSANPGSSTYQQISGNTISARRRGIFHNLAYNTASPYTLSSNTITGMADANETASWDGILLASLSPTASTSSGNIIDGSAITAIQATGISVWNCQAAPLISGGTINGVDLGINVNNFEGYPSTGSNAGNTFATIDGVTVIGATIAGIRINDNPSNTNGATVSAEVKGNTTVSGSPTGILVYGSDATGNVHNNASSITGNTIGVDVDGGSVTLFQNSITSNGTGVHVTNSGNLTSANQNFVTNNTVDGIRIEASAGNIGSINENDLSGNTGYAINDLKVFPDIDATCNWFGSTVPAVIAAEINGSVTYVPYLVSGADNAPMTDGFQPAGSCVAPCLPFTITTSSTPAGCLPATDGTALVNSVIGGTAPFTYAWSTTPVQTSAMATGLSIGTYTVTVTDLSGCTSSAGVTVGFNGQAFLYADADEDGYGNPGIDTVSCTPIPGYVSNDNDCDDITPSVNPSVTELCNGIDDNCNGQTDEGLLIIYNTDLNGDGVVSTTDFLILIAVFNQPCAGCASDINQDGVVTTIDFLLLLTKFGSGDPLITECIPADPIDFEAIYGDVLFTAGNGHWIRFFEADGDLNEKVLKSWLAEKEESAWKIRLELYPNPAKDKLFVTIDHAKTSGTAAIFDISGNERLNTHFEPGLTKLELEVDQLEAGIYTLRVRSGADFSTKKIVVIK